MCHGASEVQCCSCNTACAVRIDCCGSNRMDEKSTLRALLAAGKTGSAYMKRAFLVQENVYHVLRAQTQRSYSRRLSHAYIHAPTHHVSRCSVGHENMSNNHHRGCSMMIRLQPKLCHWSRRSVEIRSGARVLRHTCRSMAGCRNRCHQVVFFHGCAFPQLMRRRGDLPGPTCSVRNE